MNKRNVSQMIGSLCQQVESLREICVGLSHELDMLRTQLGMSSYFNSSEVDEDDDEDEVDSDVDGYVIQAKLYSKPKPGSKGKKTKPMTVYYRSKPAKVTGFAKWWTNKIDEACVFDTTIDADSELEGLGPDVTDSVYGMKVV